MAPAVINVNSDNTNGLTPMNLQLSTLLCEKWIQLKNMKILRKFLEFMVKPKTAPTTKSTKTETPSLPSGLYNTQKIDF